MSCGGQAGVRRDAQRERMSLISEHISLATRSAFKKTRGAFLTSRTFDQNEALARSGLVTSSTESVSFVAGSRLASCSGEFAAGVAAVTGGLVIPQPSATADWAVW